MHYDYLIVGSGLFGATVAEQLKNAGKAVLVLERESHVAGNAYSEKIKDIEVHKTGAHVFHTDNKKVWDYLHQFSDFNRYTFSPVARYKEEYYSLPLNMYTFYEMWGCASPAEATEKLQEQRESAGIFHPQNAEEKAISLVGTDIYEKLIKGYLQKQWGLPCRELPASAIDSLPLRFKFDTDYFDNNYQGIPVDGYTKMVEQMLTGCDVKLETDYLKEKDYWNRQADHIIYTGSIDEFYDYRFGRLEYISYRFETETLNMQNYQGNAVVNYTDTDTPWIRIVEHKWFEKGINRKSQNSPVTVITKEYPVKWESGLQPGYPVKNEINTSLYSKYKELAEQEENIVFAGRLGEYNYYDMDQTVANALLLAEKELQKY